MDLSHIKGEAIANGDQKHLYNFLQLLFELSRLFQSQNQDIMADPNVRSTPISPNLTEQGDYHRNHSVMGINQEFNNNRDYFVLDQESNEERSNQKYQQQEIKQQKQTQQQTLKSKQEKLPEAKETINKGINKNKKDKQQIKNSNNSDSQSSKRGQSAKQPQKQKQYKKPSPKQLDQDFESLPFDINNIDPELAQQYLEQMKQQGLIFSDDEQQNNLNQSSTSSNNQRHSHFQDQPSQQENEKAGQKLIHRSKSTRDLGDQEHVEGSRRQQNPKNTKQNQLKALEQNIMPVSQLQHRVITTDPHLGKHKIHEQEEDIEGAGETEQLTPENLEDMSEVDIKFLESIDPDELTQLPEDHPTIQKYARELGKIQILEQMQQQQEQMENQNIDDIIEAQIHNVKNSLSKINQKQYPMDEKETLEHIVKKRNEYKRYLRDYLKEYNQNQNQLMGTSSRAQQNLQKKIRKLKFDEKTLKEQYDKEHISMYYKMRDEKLNYLRKIHRIIFELEKRKIIDEKKDHLQKRRQQNILTRNALQSIENAYNDRINILKEKLQQERQERHTATIAQRQILSKLERELKSDKQKQIQQLKDLYKQEKDKFEYLIRDDGHLEQKILSIYKKY